MKSLQGTGLMIALLLLFSGCSTYGWADRAGEPGAIDVNVSAITAPPHLGLDTPALRRELIASLQRSGVNARAHGAAHSLICTFSSSEAAETDRLAGAALLLSCDLFHSEDRHPRHIEARSLALRPLAGSGASAAAHATHESLHDAAVAAIELLAPQTVEYLHETR